MICIDIKAEVSTEVPLGLQEKKKGTYKTINLKRIVLLHTKGMFLLKYNT